MRRLTTPPHVMNLKSEPERTQEHEGNRELARELYQHRSHLALLSHHLDNNEIQQHLWDDLPVPSVADPTDTNLSVALRLIFHMANEAGLETVLSAAYSLKHASDMEKSFPTQEEAFDRAKKMGLSPEQAAKQITATPTGHFSLYDAKKGEIVKSDRWRPPDFRTLVKLPKQSKAGLRSLVSLRNARIS